MSRAYEKGVYMDRIESIKSIQIDVDNTAKVEVKILRKDEVVEVINFDMSNIEKRNTMNEFLKVFQMDDITKVTYDGVEL